MKASRTEVTELRWFAPGHGPTLSRARARHRIDRYHVGSLSVDSAVKARGRRARLEAKVLVGRDEPIEVAGALWTPERWSKSVPSEWPTPRRGRGDHWVSVDKRIWRADGVEVCHLDLAGCPWWSLALKVRDAAVGPVARSLVEHLHASGDDLLYCAYPAWLVRQCGTGMVSWDERSG